MIQFSHMRLTVLILSVTSELAQSLAALAITQTVPSLPEMQASLSLIRTDVLLLDAHEHSEPAQLVRAVRVFPAASELPILVTISDPSSRQAVLEAGADGYILWPPLQAELAASLHRYERCHQLAQERQRLRQRAAETERLVTIGRLTASIVHNISNPMQAMRGALTLAIEDADDPACVEEYVRLTQQELERIARLVTRMRQLYRPQTDQIDAVRLPEVLRDAFELAREETMRQKVRIVDQLAEYLPPVRGIASQLHLAFLSILLNLTDAIGAKNGGELTVTTRGINDFIQVDFFTPVAIYVSTSPDGELLPSDVPDPMYGLSPLVENITQGGGRVEFLQDTVLPSSLTLRVELPVAY
jgi:signal transduction histidine kinase